MFADKLVVEEPEKSRAEMVSEVLALLTPKVEPGSEADRRHSKESAEDGDDGLDKELRLLH